MVVVRPLCFFHRRRPQAQDELLLAVEDEGAVLVLPAAARPDGQVAQRRPVSAPAAADRACSAAERASPAAHARRTHGMRAADVRVRGPACELAAAKLMRLCRIACLPSFSSQLLPQGCNLGAKMRCAWHGAACKTVYREMRE